MPKARLDAGPDTIAWHLQHHRQITVSPATISRYPAQAGLVTPEPARRPRSSYLRFEADQPSECRQADFTHWMLADETGTEILTWLDDHSRLALSITAGYRAASVSRSPRAHTARVHRTSRQPGLRPPQASGQLGRHSRANRRSAQLRLATGPAEGRPLIHIRWCMGDATSDYDIEGAKTTVQGQE
jgi:hypothetical protein